jgi:hypothetical protein
MEVRRSDLIPLSLQTRPCHLANSSSSGPLTLSSMIPRILSLCSFPARCSMKAAAMSWPRKCSLSPMNQLKFFHTHLQSPRYWSKRFRPPPSEPEAPNQLKGLSLPNDQDQTDADAALSVGRFTLTLLKAALLVVARFPSRMPASASNHEPVQTLSVYLAYCA